MKPSMLVDPAKEEEVQPKGDTIPLLADLKQRFKIIDRQLEEIEQIAQGIKARLNQLI